MTRSCATKKFLLFFLGFFRTVLLLINLKLAMIERQFQESDNAVSERRNNRMIMLKLKSLRTSGLFIVATYHMPCEWRRQRTMTTHAILASQTVQEFAQDRPLILCGDFNFNPLSYQYNVITTGKIDKSHPSYPQFPAEDPWNPTIRPMHSAYALANREPDFTNYAFTVNDKQVFHDTLDYIFISPQWRVKHVTPLPAGIANIEGPLPSLKEPSDHLCIGASLEFGGDE